VRPVSAAAHDVVVRVRRLVAIAVAVATAVLTIAAARADAVTGASPGYIALDLAIGLVLAGAAIAAAGAAAERLLVAGAGMAWLAGSVVAEARSLHQGVLLVALLAFPDGRIHGAVRWTMAAAAAVAAGGLVPLAGVAALFAAVAVVALGDSRVRSAFPAAGGSVLAVALFYAWWGGRQDVPVAPLVVYEAALIAVAAGFTVASRLVRRNATRVADTALGGGAAAGLPGLRDVLGDLLGDPGLRIELWDPAAEEFHDPVTGKTRSGMSQRAFAVRDGRDLVARVVTRSRAMTDSPTAAAVGTAVALAVANHRLWQAHERHVWELEAARRRLLTVTDRERARAAQALRTGVIAALDLAAAELARLDGGGELRLPAALDDSAVGGLQRAADDVRRIVAGFPPSALGGGRLRAAVESLAAASQVPVAVRVDPAVAADGAVESALFYVCSEALTNVAKHAHADRAWIDLRCVSGRVVIDVGDDGCGSADPRGLGLQGLADRLAAVGGRLTVSSPPGGGTVVTATVALSSDTTPARPAAPAP
jgi:signal transduction histidine kinase